MTREFAVQHRQTKVVTPRIDRLDAENSARLDRNLSVVTRDVTPWATPTDPAPWHCSRCGTDCERHRPQSQDRAAGVEE